MFRYSDGGLSETDFAEKLDCCVRAVAVIDGVVHDKFPGVPKSGKRIQNVWKLEAL
jgi:hypothetical protein